jgi:hypothetical protein
VFRRPTNAYAVFGFADYTGLPTYVLEDLEGRLRIRIARLVMNASP